MSAAARCRRDSPGPVGGAPCPWICEGGRNDMMLVIYCQDQREVEKNVDQRYLMVICSISVIGNVSFA